MRDEFLITRQGKQYVLFAGLLDEAHTRGLVGIDTELVQVRERPGDRLQHRHQLTRGEQPTAGEHLRQRAAGSQLGDQRDGGQVVVA